MSPIQPQLLFAPFQGITNKNYRNAFARHFTGFDSMYAPFISGVGLERINPSKLRDVIPINENFCPTVPQFISTDASEIILLGKTFQDYGFDHINWNLGCPFSRLANKKRGCGMLPFPGELDRILEQVFKDFQIRLSVKTRLGYYNKKEIFPVLEVLNKYPIDHLIVHPRIGTQVYSGEVDVRGFAECLVASRHQVVYNGDIFHVQRYRELQALFPGVNAWMLGRGALINPFLPGQIKGELAGDAQKRNTLMSFHREIMAANKLNLRNEARLLGSLKAIWYYMSGMFKGGRELFSSIKKATSMEEYLKAVEFALHQPFAADHDIEDYYRKGIRHVGSSE